MAVKPAGPVIVKRAVDPAQRIPPPRIASLEMKPRKVAVMGSFLTLVRETWKHLPQLVRFLLLHAAIGIGAGWLLLALLLWTDVNGVGTFDLGLGFLVCSPSRCLRQGSPSPSAERPPPLPS